MSIARRVFTYIFPDDQNLGKDQAFLQNVIWDGFCSFFYYLMVHMLLKTYHVAGRQSLAEIQRLRMYFLMSLILSVSFLFSHNFEFEILRKICPFTSTLNSLASIHLVAWPHSLLVLYHLSQQCYLYEIYPSNYFKTGIPRKMIYLCFFAWAAYSAWTAPQGSCPNELVSLEMCKSVYDVVFLLRIFVIGVFLTYSEYMMICACAESFDIYSFGDYVGKKEWKEDRWIEIRIDQDKRR
ncbi:unnamed protein product [Caenorhabditis nigoni]